MSGGWSVGNDGRMSSSRDGTEGGFKELVSSPVPSTAPQGSRDGNGGRE